MNLLMHNATKTQVELESSQFYLEINGEKTAAFDTTKNGEVIGGVCVFTKIEAEKIAKNINSNFGDRFQAKIVSA